MSPSDVAGDGRPLRPGQRIPGVGGRTHHGEEFALYDLAGAPSLVMFYPYAFSRVCGTELSAVYAAAGEFERIGARVVAISCDSLHALRAYAQEISGGEGLPFDLVSDFWPHGEIARACGAFDASRGAPTRTSYVLDPQLVIRHVHHVPSDRSRDLQEALAELAGLA
ncbi:MULTISPECIES: redoxin domain-containing protein [Actinomycetes]|uniref:Peroxiredoxin n=2 Tax=Actinomycetes TaxID=1760 RepID=A0ABP6LNV0_9MICC